MQQDKNDWRLWAKDRRRTIDIPTMTPQIVNQLASLSEWQHSTNVLLYYALPGEVKLTDHVRLEDGKRYYLPRCEADRRLAIYEYGHGKTPLISGPFGIQEPDPTAAKEADPAILDLVIVPALLYSERGERLGYGGGYYDRFLPRLRPDCLRVGVMPDALVIPELPCEPHDIPVDVIVTESRTIRRASTTELTPRPD